MSLGDQITIEQGLLKKLGYSVGVDAPMRKERCDTLRRVMSIRIQPGWLPEHYRQEWGEPNSAERLMKLVRVLTALVRNAKHRRGGRMDLAIDQWELDLQWVKGVFYNGRHTFSWPSTDPDEPWYW
jgi:hypothetical protein